MELELKWRGFPNELDPEDEAIAVLEWAWSAMANRLRPGRGVISQLDSADEDIER